MHGFCCVYDEAVAANYSSFVKSVLMILKKVFLVQILRKQITVFDWITENLKYMDVRWFQLILGTDIVLRIS